MLLENKARNSKGQTLFEIVMALAVVTIVLVSVVALVTVSVRNSSFSKNEALATRYAQSATEWLRGERDKDWDSFYAKAQAGIYCMKDESPNWNDAYACQATNIIPDTPFVRQVDFTIVSATEVKVEVSVSWSDGRGDHESRSTTVLTDWRRKL